MEASDAFGLASFFVLAVTSETIAKISTDCQQPVLLIRHRVNTPVASHCHTLWLVPGARLSFAIEATNH